MHRRKSRKTTRSSVSIYNLSDITLLEIFSKLSYEDVCRCAQVCRQWYELTQSSSLKKNIVITTYLKPEQWPQLVKYHFHENLESFEFLSRNALPRFTLVKKQTFFKLQEKCPELKKLVLKSCCLSHITLKNMPQSLKYISVRNSEMHPYNFFTTSPQNYLPYLTCLDIGGVSNFFSSEDLHIFTHLTSLRCLYLENCFRINNGGIESILDVIKHLEVLDVEGTDVSNEGVQLILTHGTMLKELFIGHLYINDEAFHEMHVDKFMKLRSLCVKRTDITFEIIKKIYKWDLKELNLFCSFDFSGNFIPIPNKNFIDLDSCSHHLSHSCSH